MKKSIHPIPEGFRTVTPSLIVRNAAEAIEFYKKALAPKKLVEWLFPTVESDTLN
jgi:PhnB protein